MSRGHGSHTGSVSSSSISHLDQLQDRATFFRREIQFGFGLLIHDRDLKCRDLRPFKPLAVGALEVIPGDQDLPRALAPDACRE